MSHHPFPTLAHLRHPAYRPAMSAASPSTAAPTPSAAPFRFLALPLELREQIYLLCVRPADALVKSAELESRGFFGGVYRFDLSLWRVCRQVRREVGRVWRRAVVTVKVGTPWPGAVNHISSEGLVPVVCTDQHADCFSDHHALVQISAPFHQAVPEHAVVLLLDDLHLFTQTWYYSALSYPSLNDRLSTAFTLRDPDMDDVDQGANKHIPLALQRKLLLPFGQVKGLHSISVDGYHNTVTRELRTAMAIPPPTLQASCELATTLLHQGDALLPADPPAAQAAYTAAFHAIHILISGRTRRVLADAFFHAHIPSGIYAGQTGMMVRVILRLKLVARMQSVLLLRGCFADSLFWGLRSARIMRESMDPEFEAVLAELVGGADVCLIHVRAGIALWLMKRDLERWGVELGGLEEEGLDEGKFVEEGARHLRGGREQVRAEMERYGLPSGLMALFGEREGEAGERVEE